MSEEVIKSSGRLRILRHCASGVSSMGTISSMNTASTTNSSSSRRSPTKTPSIPLSQTEKGHRIAVLRDFLRSETNYVQDLTYVKTVFERPLNENKESYDLTETDFSNLFSTWALLLQIHEKIATTLSLRLPQKDVDGSPRATTVVIGDLLSYLSISFNSYIQYCNNISLALTTHFRLTQSNTKVTKFFDTEEQTKCLSFRFWLLQPLNRFFYYFQLCRLLVYLTPTDHADFDNLQTSKDLLDSADPRCQIRNDIRNILKGVEIQQSCDGLTRWIPSPTRRLLRRGQLELRFHPNSAGDTRNVILFSDLILLASQKSDGRYDVDKYFDFRPHSVSATQTDATCFEVYIGENDKMIFYHDNEKEILSWIVVFATLMTEVEKEETEVEIEEQITGLNI
jgi:hypothetical protein